MTMTIGKRYHPEPQSAYYLAGEAEVASPDGLSSPGAQFLLGVQSAVIEAVRWDLAHDGFDSDNVEDVAAEIADGAVPVYTGELWAVFVDLAAYNEDIDSQHLVRITVDGPVLEVGARVALYNIAERLATVLLNEAADTLAGVEDEDEDEDDSPSAAKEDGRNEWLTDDEG